MDGKSGALVSSWNRHRIAGNIMVFGGNTGSVSSDYRLITVVCIFCAVMSQLSSLCLSPPLPVAMPLDSGCKSRRCRFRE